MIEVLLGVGLSAHKWSAPQQCSATQMVSPAASDDQPYAHAHVLKVQSSFDRLRSEVKGEGQPFCTSTVPQFLIKKLISLVNQIM